MSDYIYSKDRDYIVWFHDGVHGTKGVVMIDAEWEAIVEGVTPSGQPFSVGKKPAVRKFKPYRGGVALVDLTQD